MQGTTVEKVMLHCYFILSVSGYRIRAAVTFPFSFHNPSDDGCKSILAETRG